MPSSKNMDSGLNKTMDTELSAQELLQSKSENNYTVEQDNVQEPLQSKSEDSYTLEQDNKDLENMESIEEKKCRRNRRFRIIKNIFALSFAIVLLFTSIYSLMNLQSSLNNDHGLGVASLGLIYAMMIVSNLFFTPILIHRFGCKNILLICIPMYCIFIAANFKSSWYTMIPASIFAGMAAGPLWAAQSTYITESGIQYSSFSTMEKASDIISRFFGIFCMFLQTAEIWGSLIASLVLSSEGGHSFSNSTSEMLTCGSDFCPYVYDDKENNTNLEPPPEFSVHVLCGIYMATALSGFFIILIFVDHIKVEKIKEVVKESDKSITSLFLKTIRQLKDKRQLLLIPVTIFTGLEEAFLAGDLTLAFVTCEWGIENVGYVVMAYGIMNAICSLSFGTLTKLIGRIPIFVSGMIINFSAILTMFFWKPSADEPIVFFVIAALWGMGDAVWQSQLLALYGSLFSNNQEAGFSNKGIWECLGFVISYAYSHHLCTDIKLYLLLVFLGLGMCGYFFVEYLERKNYKVRVKSPQKHAKNGEVPASI